MTKEKAREWLYEIVKYPTEDTIIELVSELEAQIEEMKRCLSMWYEYENERDTPHINIDKLLTETQQLIS